MSRATSESWYRIALADDEHVRLAVAPGPHLGAAIATAVSRLGKAGRVWPVAAAPAPPGDVPLGESVGKGVVVEREAPTGLHRFAYPSGVVPALADGGRGAPVEVGWRASDGPEALVLEAVAAGDDARERFLDVVEHLPAVDNVEVRIADHYDGGQATEVWLTPRLRDVRRAIRFLDDFEVDLLDSGHIDVAVYVREPRSTWRLTQHKTLVLLTEDPAVRDLVRGRLTGAGLTACDPLITVADAPHFHYRPATSSVRTRLLNRLSRARLRKVDTLVDA